MSSGSDIENGHVASRNDIKAAATEDDLPYRVELWDEEKKIILQVLAFTAHGSIGYAAYYAATREYPDRFITLRHKNRTIARSIEPGQ